MMFLHVKLKRESSNLTAPCKRRLAMFRRSWKRFVDDADGATAIEYGLIAALIVAAIVGGVTLLGTNADATYTTLASKVK
jgi:pilus assembly protein Flp/PilA